MKYLFYFFIGFSLNLYAQDYSREISFTSENDVYMMFARDGYYTNGLFLEYHWKGIKENRTHHVSIGQRMYNSEYGDYRFIDLLDRPVTAYLYTNYSQINTKSSNLFQWGVSIGAIGPIALGKETQKIIHNLFNLYKPQEWKFQLKNSIGINVNFLWAKEIPLNDIFELQSVIKSDIGFFFDNIELAPLLRFGKFNSNNSSSLWNTRTNGSEKDNEFFIYIMPLLSINAYNATVQGGMFRKDKGPYIGKLNPLLFKCQIGVNTSFNRATIQLKANYTKKESKTQIRSQWYGTINIKYLFN